MNYKVFVASPLYESLETFRIIVDFIGVENNKLVCTLLYKLIENQTQSVFWVKKNRVSESRIVVFS